MCSRPNIFCHLYLTDATLCFYFITDGNLFNLTRLLAKRKMCKFFTRKIVHDENTGLTAHSNDALQQLVTCFTKSCAELRPKIAKKRCIYCIKSLAKMLALFLAFVLKTTPLTLSKVSPILNLLSPTHPF